MPIVRAHTKPKTAAALRDRRVASTRTSAPRSIGPWAFGAFASLYDWQLPLERAALRAAIELAAPEPDELLLDVGTGTGALLRELARRHPRPSHAVGIDSSPAMLEQAVALPEGWQLRVADARRLPFADATVDVVTCAYLIQLLDGVTRQAVLDEIARVLRPGGRVVIVSLVAARGLLGRAVLAPLTAAVCRAGGRPSGFCALDPRPGLLLASLAPQRGRWVTRGYPSFCVLARRHI
ncbi:MAG: class I SAM-dependent methyltransferase [Solirubrobacteraceae bacterium]